MKNTFNIYTYIYFRKYRERKQELENFLQYGSKDCKTQYTICKLF